jgi:hypothetical protein
MPHACLPAEGRPHSGLLLLCHELLLLQLRLAVQMLWVAACLLWALR